jgi:hypothetical protein
MSRRKRRKTNKWYSLERKRHPPKRRKVEKVNVPISITSDNGLSPMSTVLRSSVSKPHEFQDFCVTSFDKTSEVVNLERDELYYTNKDRSLVIVHAVRNNCLAFCEDYPNGNGSKKYFSCDLKRYIKRVCASKEQDRRFHIIYIPNRPVKLELDVEAKVTGNETMVFTDRILYIIDTLIKFLEEGGTKNITRDCFFTTIASRGNKYSAHIILYKGVVFENTTISLCFLYKYTNWVLKKELRILLDTSTKKTDKYEKFVEMNSILHKVKKSYSIPCWGIPDEDEDEDEDDDEDKFLLQYSSMIDLMPYETSLGSMRLYGSVKTGDSLMKESVLDQIVFSGNGKAERVHGVEKKWIIHSISQVALSQVDGLKTKCIVFKGDMTDVSTVFHEYKMELKKLISFYTYKLYSIYNVPVTTMDDT